MAGMDEVMRMLMEMRESAAKEQEDNCIHMEAMQEDNHIRIEAMQREIAELKGDGGPSEPHSHGSDAGG
jgi:hypothetical protein